jgi:hypothetical protein
MLFGEKEKDSQAKEPAVHGIKHKVLRELRLAQDDG